MAEPKTRPTGADVTAFLDAVPADRRRAEGHAVRAIMERVTGAPAAMWGPSIVGFGSAPYTNTAGTYEWPVVAFSPRAASITFYGLHNGYGPPDPLLDRLGPHTVSKACLYVKRLDAVDQEILERLIAQAWASGAGEQ